MGASFILNQGMRSMTTFEQPEMQVARTGEEVPSKLTFKGIGQKLEDLIAEKLNAHEHDGRILTCAEIHDLASAYAELSKVGAPFDWCRFNCENSSTDEVNLNAGTYE